MKAVFAVDKNPAWLRSIAAVQRDELGDQDAAAATYKQAMEMDLPDDASAAKSLASLLQKRKPDGLAQAEAVYARAIEKNPNDSTLWANYADVIEKAARVGDDFICARSSAGC